MSRPVADSVGIGPERGRAFRWWTLGACAVGLAVRLAYALVVRSGAPLQGDAVYYHGQAKLNLEGSWFVNPMIVAVKHHPAALVPSAQHPPLFTLVLTLGDLFGLRSVTAQLVLVCVLGTATVALVALVARDLAGPRAGSIAAVVAALYPGMWIFDGEVMSEALVMLVAVATVLVAVRCFRTCTPWRVALLGLLTGVCALTRAELVLLVPLVALPTVLWQRSMDVRRRLTLCTLAVAAALAPMVPWFAYNATRFHHSVTLSDQLQVTLAAANNASTYSGPLTASWCFTCVQSVHFPRTWDESDQGAYWQSQAVHYIEAHKARAIEVAFERMGLEWNLYAPIRQAGHDFLEGWPVPVSDAWLVWYYPMTVAAIAGAVILRRRRQPVYPLVAMYVVVTVVAFVTYGNYRFRAEAEAATVVLAAVALDALWSAVAGRPARTPVHRRAPSPDPAPLLPSPQEVAV